MCIAVARGFARIVELVDVMRFTHCCFLYLCAGILPLQTYLFHLLLLPNQILVCQGNHLRKKICLTYCRDCKPVFLNFSEFFNNCSFQGNGNFKSTGVLQFSIHWKILHKKQFSKWLCPSSDQLLKKAFFFKCLRSDYKVLHYKVPVYNAVVKFWQMLAPIAIDHHLR